MLKRIMLLSILIFLCTHPNIVKAVDIYPYNNKLTTYKSIDDTIAYYFKTSSDKMKLHMFKVFPTNEAFYYYFSTEINDKILKDNQVKGLVLKINGVKVDVKEFDNLPTQKYNTSFLSWHVINEDITDQLLKCRKIELDLISETGKIIKTYELNEEAITTVVQLSKTKKEQFFRDGTVYDTAKYSSSGPINPQLFIPNVSPVDIRNAFIIKSANTYHFIEGNTPNILTLWQRTIARNSAGVFITFCYIPKDKGVWANINITRMYPDGKRMNYLYRSRSIFESRRETSKESDKLARDLLEIYQEYYGRYDFGIKWEEKRTEENGNIFTLVQINKEEFPELAEIAPNSILRAINDIDTTFMKNEDICYLLDTNSNPVVLTIGESEHTAKQITIKPIFRPSIGKQSYIKSYATAIESYKARTFKRSSFSKLPATEIVYNAAFRPIEAKTYLYEYKPLENKSFESLFAK